MLARLDEETICRNMQRLLSLFVAFALLMVPLGMISGAAAAHAGTGREAMATSDCHQSVPAPEKKSKGVGMSAECALACAALPAMPGRLEVPEALGPTVHSIVALYGLVTAGPESLDPPPRA
jgi:hypothetical protein